MKGRNTKEEKKRETTEKKGRQEWSTICIPTKLFRRCQAVNLAAGDFGYASVAELFRDAARRHVEMMEAHVEKVRALSELSA